VIDNLASTLFRLCLLENLARFSQARGSTAARVELLAVASVPTKTCVRFDGSESPTVGRDFSCWLNNSLHSCLRNSPLRWRLGWLQSWHHALRNIHGCTANMVFTTRLAKLKQRKQQSFVRHSCPFGDLQDRVFWALSTLIS